MNEQTQAKGGLNFAIRRFLPVMMALLAAVGFAANDLLFRKLSGINPWVILLLCNAAFFVLCAGVRVAQKRKLWAENWPLALMLGVVRAVTILLAFLALTKLEVSNYYLVLYLFPLWVMVAGVIFLKEMPRKLQVGGLGLALAGVGLVFYRGGLEAGVGVYYALGCSISLAIQILISRKLAGESVFSLGVINGLTAIILAGGMLIAQGGTHGAWGNLATPEVLGVVVLSVLAPLAMLYANQRFKAFAYALFSYLQIPIALLGAWFFLGEDIQGLTGIGLGLVVLGSLASQLPEKRR